MGEEKEKKIKVLQNGPYEVSGAIALNQLRFVPDLYGASLAYQEVRRYTIEETYYLCRCGHSGHKPFCDGHHRQGFDAAETARHATYDEMAHRIEGRLVNLMDAEELCAIARFCDTHGSTWHLVSESADPASVDIVREQCANCPSGRLTAVTKEGERLEPKLPKEISVLEDPAARVHGPLWVKGGIPVADGNGRLYPVRNRVTLCRCGHSRNKPFCDGRHMETKGEVDGGVDGKNDGKINGEIDGEIDGEINGEVDGEINSKNNGENQPAQ